MEFYPCSIPAHLVERDVLPTSHEEGPEDPIDLSKLTALRRFAVHLTVESCAPTRTLFPWLSKILRSGCSTSVIQQLEELSIRVLYGNDCCYSPMINILHWKDTFDTLLDKKFKNLRNLNIDAYSQRDVEKAVGTLNRSRDIARLRSQRNLVVDIRRE